MTKEKINGHIAIFATNIFFGLNIPIAKTLMPDWISPMGLTFMRMAFGAIAFWGTSIFFKYEKVPLKDIGILFVCALLGTTLNQLAFINGLRLTSPIDAGLISTLNPVIVMLIAAVILKEPITSKKAMGVFIGACGALLIVWQSSHNQTPGESHLLGNLFCFISVICYAMYLVISKPIAQKYSAITLMKWMFLFSSLLLLPFGATEAVDAKIFSTDSSALALWSLFYVVFCATFLAYLLIPIALKRLRPTTISMYNYLQPIVGSILAIIIGQDFLTWDKPVAAILVFTGVYIVTQSKSRADIEKEIASK